MELWREHSTLFKNTDGVREGQIPYNLIIHMCSLRNTDTRRQTKKTLLNTEDKLEAARGGVGEGTGEGVSNGCKC